MEHIMCRKQCAAVNTDYISLICPVIVWLLNNNNWSERSACAMCRWTQWPLLTELFISFSPLSSLHVFTYLPEGLYQGFWIFACKLMLTKKKEEEKCKKIGQQFQGIHFVRWLNILQRKMDTPKYLYKWKI